MTNCPRLMRSLLAPSGRKVLFASILAVPLMWVLAAHTLHAARAGVAGEQAPVRPGDPWKASDLIEPQQLSSMLSQPKGQRPVIIYVGFDFMYQAGHIPGALYFGAAREPTGVAKLSKWARGLRPNQPVVMYCGCCPWTECPNVRPAYRALRDAGLTRLKVLYLPDSFLRDWVDKGFPVEEGKRKWGLATGRRRLLI
jgi:thiosulfate/3-mercaptopyruvate sulfurtransferase